MRNCGLRADKMPPVFPLLAGTSAVPPALPRSTQCPDPCGHQSQRHPRLVLPIQSVSGPLCLVLPAWYATRPQLAPCNTPSQTSPLPVPPKAVRPSVVVSMYHLQSYMKLSCLQYKDSTDPNVRTCQRAHRWCTTPAAFVTLTFLGFWQAYCEAKTFHITNCLMKCISRHIFDRP